MTEGNKTIADRKFIEELVERFFNPKSYFYHVFQIFLSDDSYLQKNGDSVHQLISSLLKYLLASNSPAKEMKEISQLSGFDKFYIRFESKLSDVDYSELSREQTKEFIRQLAKQCFEDWALLFSQHGVRDLLKSYLNLKEKLFHLFNDSNASDTYYDVSNSQLLNSDKQNRSGLVAQSTELIEDVSADQKLKNAAFQQFFKTELETILSQINEDSFGTNNGNGNDEALESLNEIFFNVNEIAKFHEFERIEIISERFLEIIQSVIDNKSDFKISLVELILDGKNDILSCLNQDLPHKKFETFLQKYDNFLEELKLQKNSEENFEKEFDEKNSTQFDDTQQVEYNTVITREARDDGEEDDSENNDDRALKVAYNPKYDQSHFKLPGEDNEDLMNLIKEVGISMSMPAEKNNTGEDNNINDFLFGEKMQEKPTLNEPAFESKMYDRFVNESQLFFQVIFEAVSRIQNNKENGTSSLDDLELASASLKQLAKKLSLEKIAFFPELIESICINASMAELKLPTIVLESITMGSSLIQDLMPSDSGNENKLIAQLSTLKEYYAYTLRAIEQLPVTS